MRLIIRQVPEKSQCLCSFRNKDIIGDRGCSQLQNDWLYDWRASGSRALPHSLSKPTWLGTLKTRAFVRKAAMLRTLSTIIAKSKVNIRQRFGNRREVQIIRTNVLWCNGPLLLDLFMTLSTKIVIVQLWLLSQRERQNRRIKLN